MTVDTSLDSEGNNDLEDAIARLANRGERLVFSIPEAAALLGISQRLAYDLGRRGELPTMQLGRRRVVPRWALARLVAMGAASPTDVVA